MLVEKVNCARVSCYLFFSVFFFSCGSAPAGDKYDIRIWNSVLSAASALSSIGGRTCHAVSQQKYFRRDAQNSLAGLGLLLAETRPGRSVDRTPSSAEKTTSGQPTQNKPTDQHIQLI